MKRTFIPLMLCAAFALLSVACGGSDTSSNNSTANTANKATSNTATTANTTSSTANSNTTSSSGEKIGVPECDEYIAKYEACLNSKVPEANRAQLKTAFEQSRAAWRTAASTPQSKASLPGLCKQAMEQARTAMKSYGCDF